MEPPPFRHFGMKTHRCANGTTTQNHASESEADVAMDEPSVLIIVSSLL